MGNVGSIKLPKFRHSSQYHATSWMAPDIGYETRRYRKVMILPKTCNLTVMWTANENKLCVKL